MLIDALVLDCEELENIPISASILIDSALVGLNDLVEVFAATAGIQKCAAHELLTVFDGVLNCKRNLVAVHTVYPDHFVVLHLTEFTSELIRTLAIGGPSVGIPSYA